MASLGLALIILGATVGHLQGFAGKARRPGSLKPATPARLFCLMSTGLKLPPRITVDQFLEWEPDDRSGALWQLRDGEPEMMAPASDRHGSIQSELAYLITAHLRGRNSPRRLVIAPGVVPAERSEDNCLSRTLASRVHHLPANI